MCKSIRSNRNDDNYGWEDNYSTNRSENYKHRKEKRIKAALQTKNMEWLMDDDLYDEYYE